MKWISVPIAAAAALALSLPAPAFAQSTDAPGLDAATARAQQTMVDQANSLPVVADPKAVSTRAAIGSYPTRKGVILVTPDKYAIFNVGHAAIVFEDGKLTESVSTGVKWSANDWKNNKTQIYGVAPHATSRAQDAAASTWASHQRGKPYNWVFTDVNTRSKFYCSQLVWAAFKDNFGVDLNRDIMGAVVYPMELVTNGKVYLLYRKQ